MLLKIHFFRWFLRNAQGILCIYVHTYIQRFKPVNWGGVSGGCCGCWGCCCCCSGLCGVCSQNKQLNAHKNTKKTKERTQNWNRTQLKVACCVNLSCICHVWVRSKVQETFHGLNMQIQIQIATRDRGQLIKAPTRDRKT